MHVGYKKSQATYKPWVAFLVIIPYLVIINILATQYLAYYFGYHSSLGEPLYAQYYTPWSWIIWTTIFYDAYTNVFNLVFFSSVCALFVGAIAFISISVLSKSRSKGSRSLHGTAHFASLKEVKETGLLDQKKGVYIGGFKDHYLRHNGPEHVFVFAPTRSGKGVGLILPTLLSWEESALVLDIKGENWALTAGWRKEHAGNKVLRFEPTCNDGTGCCFNPLEEIRIGTDHEIADTQNIINIVAAPDDPNAKIDPHFDPVAKTLLSGFTLHFAHQYKDNDLVLSLPDLVKEISSRPVAEILDEMKNTAYSPYCEQIAIENIDRLEISPKEFGGILSSARKFIALYRDPILAKNISHSDFKIRDLMFKDQPVSLYFVIAPSDIARLAPLTKVLIDMVIKRLASEMHFADGKTQVHYKNRLLLMLDEFPAFGSLKSLETSLAYIASYGMKAYLICQDLVQIKKAYTQYETITPNCHIKIAYPPNNEETAKLISSMTGTTTIVKTKVSTSGNRTAFFNSRVSTTTDEISRPLLTPDEVTRIGGPEKDARGNITKAGKMLIFVTGKSPILGEQILYFKDHVFDARSKVLPPKNSDKIIPKKKTIFDAT